MSGKFDMGDYVQVNERIVAFYAKHPEGSLQSELVELNDHLVVMRAYAYRSPDDPRPGIGYSSLGIPGTTPYTKGSEVENCETSAWGRAIAALGFEVKRGIASAEEVRNKSGGNGTRNKPVPVADKFDGALIGTVELAKDFPDFLPKQSPEGPVLAFKLVAPGGGIKVVATGAIAELLPLQRDEVIGQRVSCWGRVRDETFKPKGAQRDITYQVLDLQKIQTPTFTLPAAEDTGPEPPDDVELAVSA